MERTSSRRVLKIAAIGLMAALVFVGNYIQFPIPNGVLLTRLHLGNSMCLLAGLLFCGSSGGLASGIGAAMFDLFNPAYVLSAPYTFVSKFMMGYVAGRLNRRNPDGKIPIQTTIFAAVAGQVVYIVLYLLKSFFTILLLGGTAEAAWAAVGTNAITSCVNAVASVVVAVPLYAALRHALNRTPMKPLINEQSERKGYFNPLTVGLLIFAFVTTTIYTMNLSATGKLEKAEAEEKAQYEAKIDELESKIDNLYSQLRIEIPVEEAE